MWGKWIWIVEYFSLKNVEPKKSVYWVEKSIFEPSFLSDNRKSLSEKPEQRAWGFPSLTNTI